MLAYCTWINLQFHTQFFPKNAQLSISKLRCHWKISKILINYLTHQKNTQVLNVWLNESNYHMGTQGRRDSEGRQALRFTMI